MIRIIIFIVVSAFFVYLSRESLIRPKSHGFYRFFAFESITILILLNILDWFKNPFSLPQLFSWLFLFTSLYLVIHGVYLLWMIGRPDSDREGDELISFEKTSELVTTGAYQYIRHPLYSSLLFLTLGAFLKQPSWTGLFLTLTAIFSLLLTAKADESECIEHFGNPYQNYMERTKRFIPFLF